MELFFTELRFSSTDMRCTQTEWDQKQTGLVTSGSIYVSLAKLQQWVGDSESSDCTAKEGTVRIQYKCLVLIYVLPEMKRLFPKQNYNVLSPSSYTHMSVRDLCIYRIGLPTARKYVDRSWEYINGSQTHEFGNWD
jgi:hypothetical protein